MPAVAYSCLQPITLDQLRLRPMYTIDTIIRAYSDWIVEQQECGWRVFLTTVMFNPLPGSTAAALLAQMTKQIERRLYPELCRRLERHPGRKGRTDRLPRW